MSEDFKSLIKKKHIFLCKLEDFKPIKSKRKYFNFKTKANSAIAQIIWILTKHKRHRKTPKKKTKRKQNSQERYSFPPIACRHNNVPPFSIGTVRCEARKNLLAYFPFRLNNITGAFQMERNELDLVRIRGRGAIRIACRRAFVFAWIGNVFGRISRLSCGRFLCRDASALSSLFLENKFPFRVLL